jgi:formylglycine-generating enzyme required for sulfatase activity
MSIQDEFNENHGMMDAMGNMAAISQRNRMLEQQREQAKAIQLQTAALEAQNRIEQDRAKIEQQRFELEKQRMLAEELDKSMRLAQAEQTKQVRNLLADSLAGIEDVELSWPAGGGRTSSDLLRAVGALQANLVLLESQSQTLVELADMQALRGYKSRLAKFVAAHAAAGSLPADPLATVRVRVEHTARFLAKAGKLAREFKGLRKDWLREAAPNGLPVPAVGRKELQAALEKVRALSESLPEHLETLRVLIDPQDWHESDIPQEYLICAEGGAAIPLPPDRAVRRNLYALAHGFGPLVGEIRASLAALEQRIKELLAIRERHRVVVEEVVALTAQQQFRGAAGRMGAILSEFPQELVKSQSRAAWTPFSYHGFSDVPYKSAMEGLQALFAIHAQCVAAADSCQARLRKEGAAPVQMEVKELRALLVQLASELGQEGALLCHAISADIDRFLLEKRQQRLIILGVVALVITGFLILVRDAAAARAKAEAMAEMAQQEATAALAKKPQEALAEKEAMNKRAAQSAQTLALVPAGSFSMGDSFGEGASNERPVRQVTVSAFYLGKAEVTKGEWDEVKDWASGHGYTDLSAGEGKAANHPVTGVNWWDAVKWCNARSEREGLVPCYAVGGSPMRTGTTVPEVNWSAKGYRLPTEAEWEKAARGGLSGKRFPWGDTISHSLANYESSSSKTYEVSPTQGNHPSHGSGTSPAGSFAANAYELQDMAGNVCEWCWDWYEAYASRAQTDPWGAASGTYRVVRGGSWNNQAYYCRAAYRYSDYGSPGYQGYALGFRVVRSSAL